MALSMTNATYGRSKQGTNELITDIENDIERVIKAIDGDQYTELKKIASNNWSGADKDAFIEDLDKKRAALKNKLKTLKKQIRNVLEQDYQNFVKGQKSNYQAK